MRSGFSLVELAIGVLLTALAGLVMARMLAALVKGARYTMRQTASLTAGRRALQNVGGDRGMVWAAQEAQAVRSLSTSTLQLTLPGPVDLDYAVVGSSALFKNEGGAYFKQAPDISSMTLSYYEIAANGLIAQSTSATNASLVQILMTVKGKTSKERSYSILSSAWVRNK